MVLGIFGESCTGKSTIAAELGKRMNATVYTGKDYLKFAKNETEARKLFADHLKGKSIDTNVMLVYVISEPEHLGLLPEGAVRVLVTAPLELIQKRFAKRMNGDLPPPVATMLENKHGVFDNEDHDLHVKSDDQSLSNICDHITILCKG